jgi:hypothetical protein
MSRAISSLLAAAAFAAAWPALAQAAAPGVPELFYGSAPGRVGSEIDAIERGAVVASTTLGGGTYGAAPRLLLVPDPQGSGSGAIVTFSIGGIAARERARFENGAITKLDLTLPERAATSSGEDSGSQGAPASSTPPRARPDAAYDLTGDGRVDYRDLARLLARWGLVGLLDPADLDGDGTVGLLDFNQLIFHFSL